MARLRIGGVSPAGSNVVGVGEQAGSSVAAAAARPAPSTARRGVVAELDHAGTEIALPRGQRALRVLRPDQQGTQNRDLDRAGRVKPRCRAVGVGDTGVGVERRHRLHAWPRHEIGP